MVSHAADRAASAAKLACVRCETAEGAAEAAWKAGYVSAKAASDPVLSIQTEADELAKQAARKGRAVARRRSPRRRRKSPGAPKRGVAVEE